MKATRRTAEMLGVYQKRTTLLFRSWEKLLQQNYTNEDKFSAPAKSEHSVLQLYPELISTWKLTPEGRLGLGGVKN